MDILQTFFDGRIWKEWQYVGGQPYMYLASPRNYAFMLNVDWFQPFKHSLYSVGALYVVLMNLPRSERFKPENVFLVGVIPGPHEPKHNINSYLQPRGEMALVSKNMILLKMKNSMLHFFVFAVTSQQQEKFAHLLAMAQIKAAQSVRNFSLDQLLLKLIFQDLNHLLQEATMNIDMKHRRF